MRQKANVHMLPIIVFLLVVTNGILGVDFGYHWDEPLTLRSVQHSVQTGLFLPRRYYYPSLTYDLSFLGFVPSIIKFQTGHATEQGTLKEYLSDVAATKSFQLRVRMVCIVVAALSILWTYLLVLYWRRNRVEAFLACSILGLSWEYSYHLRWIAPDAIMMQFAVLAILLLFIGRTSEQPLRWFRFAAVTAGFACATKYPGGLVLLPVLLSVCLLPTPSLTWRFRALVEICFIACISYLFVSPGTILDLYTSIAHITYEINHYATGHWGYTVEPLKQHLQLILEYCTFALFSKYVFISLSFFITSIIGMYALFREKLSDTTLFLILPIIYVMYLSTQKVMIVRNLLVLLPFFAILAAHGITYLCSNYALVPLGHALVVAFVAGLLLFNIGWAMSSTYSIMSKDTTNYIEQLREYVIQRRTTTFWVSESVYQALRRANYQLPSNLTNVMRDADTAIFSSDEVGEYEWQANRYNYTETWFGPYEVNFNYYPSWTGDKRIVVMPVQHALQLPSLATRSQ